MKILATIACFLGIFLSSVEVRAQDNGSLPPSLCQAIASHETNGGWPGIQFTELDRKPFIRTAAQLAQTSEPTEVTITFVGHSTFRIEDKSGLIIATDFAGFAGPNIIPTVVTMNHAHGTHFTVAPDNRIKHVLRGWGLDGKPARHYRQIGSALIRNVTTDINNQWAGFEPNGNSIFIFEIAGLCIGHLGHLHHLPTDAHYSQIGRLDILMVPVDGGHTMNVEDMSMVVRRVNASMILPMHWFGTWSLGNFLTEIESSFPIENKEGPTINVSLNTLPQQPTVIVLPPEGSFDQYDGD